MPDLITITGLVATNPRHILTSEGLSITSFRLASTQRKFDRSQERWVDADTNWYTITTFRQLALNCATSLEKGQRILVTGKLRIREWDNGERVGTNIDIEAEAVGHDLSWGTSNFSRSIVSTPVAAEPDAGPAAGSAPGASPEATAEPVPEHADAPVEHLVDVLDPEPAVPF